VLAPGVVGPQAWAGVLMPSCDRVGRYFPLTIAQPLAALPGSDTGAQSLLDWLLRIDDLAVDALHEDWSVERVEAELARVQWQDTDHAGPLCASVLELAAEQTLWVRHGEQGAPVLRLARHLPSVSELLG
jgi:hypothetical protein